MGFHVVSFDPSAMWDEKKVFILGLKQDMLLQET